MIPVSVKELLLQSLVHERGGVMVYRTALSCAKDPKLHDEWAKFLRQTENHVRILEALCRTVGIDPGEVTPGCAVVEHMGRSLVKSMQMASAEGDARAAERVACECVLLAEVKDQANWELIGDCVGMFDGTEGRAFEDAYDQVAAEEDEHVEHARDWGRQLWSKALEARAETVSQSARAGQMSR